MRFWAAYLVVLAVTLIAAIVGGFIGTLGGVEWAERRRTRDLRRKRANIQRALERDET